MKGLAAKHEKLDNRNYGRMEMELRVCFFGDSFVNGTRDPDCLGWVGRVCASAWSRGHGVTGYNGGIRRNTSADVRGRWRREAESRLRGEFRGALVFSFGVNDCVGEDGRRRVAETETIANAKVILGEACAWLPTLMVGPAPIAVAEVNERVKQLVPALKIVCDELHVPFLDIFGTLRSSGVWMREVAEGEGDGAHPSRGGYAELAAIVDGWASWREWLP
jgi:acyl-CoA thioesterase-1